MDDQRNAVRRAYDEMAETYAAERADDPPEIDLLDDLAARLDPGARVLDAGCGQGTPVASRLAGRFDVAGLDFSRAQLALAARAVPAAAFVRGDMTALPFADGSFDAVCALYSIIHVPTDEHPVVFREFARVLRPGGSLLLTAGDQGWEGSNPDWLESGVEMRWSYPALDATLDQLSDAGFEAEEERIFRDGLSDEGGFPFVMARLV